MKHTLRRSTAPLALICLLALTAAGCGGSSNRTESYSGLITKANALCTTVTAQVKAATAAQQWDKIVSDSKAAIAALKKLTPPDKLKASYEDYLTKQQATIDAAVPVAAALKAGDQAKAQQLAAASQPLNDASDAAALKAGLAICGAKS